MDFSSVHNSHESAVVDAVEVVAANYPAVSSDPDLLADVVCVALNRLPPHYIRHDADRAFFRTDRERIDDAKQVSDAVEHAFGFVQARHLMAARR